MDKKRQRPASVSVQNEGVRAVDKCILELVREPDIRTGQVVEVVSDRIDQTGLEAVYSFERHTLDESGNEHDATTDGGDVFIEGTEGTPEIPAQDAVGPWAYLRFENNLNDESGNGNTPQSTGTVGYVNAPTGSYGKQIILNSAAKNIRWTNAPSPRSPFSLSFNLDGHSVVGSATLVEWGNFTIEQVSTTSAEISFGGTSNTVTIPSFATSTRTITCTWDGTTFRVYIEGALSESWTATTTDITDSSTLQFNGTNDAVCYDQLQIYEGVLSAANVTTISGSETSVTTEAMDAVPEVPSTPDRDLPLYPEGYAGRGMQVYGRSEVNLGNWLDATGVWEVAFWFKSPQDTDTQRVFGRTDWHLETSDGVLRVEYGGSTTSTMVDVCDDAWHLIRIGHDGTNVFVAVDDTTVMFSYTGFGDSGDVKFGGDDVDVDFIVDACRIYVGRVLGDADVATLRSKPEQPLFMVFAGRVSKVDKKIVTTTIEAYSFGRELALRQVLNETYNSITVEDLVEQLITLHTTLGFVNVGVEARTLDGFRANGSIVEVLVSLLNYETFDFYVDARGRFTLVPSVGDRKYPRAFVHGGNCVMEVDVVNDKELVSDLVFEGGEVDSQVQTVTHSESSARLLDYAVPTQNVQSDIQGRVSAERAFALPGPVVPGSVTMDVWRQVGYGDFVLHIGDFTEFSVSGNTVTIEHSARYISGQTYTVSGPSFTSGRTWNERDSRSVPGVRVINWSYGVGGADRWRYVVRYRRQITLDTPVDLNFRSVATLDAGTGKTARVLNRAFTDERVLKSMAGPTCGSMA